MASAPVQLPHHHRYHPQTPAAAVVAVALGNREVVAVVVLTWLSPIEGIPRRGSSWYNGCL
jgi:hypothetical protein